MNTLLHAAQLLRTASWIFGALALFATIARGEPTRAAEAPAASVAVVLRSATA